MARARREGVQLQAERNNGDLLGGGDLVGDQVLPGALADGDQPVGVAAQELLDADEDARLARAEIAGEDMAVERMVQALAAAGKGEEGGCAAERAGLGSVGVDDIGLLATHQGYQL